MESGVVHQSVIESITDRQEGLIGNFSESSAVVVGLGGIGSWIAVDLALVGIGTLILYDTDTVEASNLNRTLFKLSHIGQPKTIAVKELISERRKDTIVITNDVHFTAEHLQKLEGVDYLFDCSDTTKLKDEVAQVKEKPKYIKLGYDGFEATICVNDFESGKWGTDSSYTVTPSFFAPPQLLSAIGIIEMLLVKKAIPRTIHFNTKKILTQLSKYNMNTNNKG
jgi:molybdopterin/thiamine biosynthesis adenylyltransferase